MAEIRYFDFPFDWCSFLLTTGLVFRSTGFVSQIIDPDNPSYHNCDHQRSVSLVIRCRFLARSAHQNAGLFLLYILAHRTYFLPDVRLGSFNLFGRGACRIRLSEILVPKPLSVRCSSGFFLQVSDSEKKG